MESPGANPLRNEEILEPTVEKTRAQYIQEVMKGQNPQDRAYIKDEKGYFASPDNENAMVNVRDRHIEEARQEMNDDLAQREKNTRISENVLTPTQSQNLPNNKVGEISDKVQMASATEPRTNTSLRTAAEIAVAGEGQVEQRYNAQEKKDLHQEALNRNAEINKIPSIEETLRAGKPRYNLKVQRTSGEIEDGWFATGVFQDQNGVEKVRIWKESQDGTVLRKDVKLEELSKWNENSHSGLSKRGQEFLRDSDEIQRDLRGKSFKESLTELMDEGDAQRYLEFLTRDLPESQVWDTEASKIPSIQKVFADIDQKLSQTQERLSGIDSRIAGINSQLTEIQTSGNLSQGQLLEHMRLSQEFQGLISQKFDILLEQQRLNSERSRALYEDLINRISDGDQSEIPTTPGVSESRDAPTIPVTPTLDTSSTQEDTPEQKVAAIGRQMAELDAIKENRSLTDKEKIQYFDLLEAKKTINTQLQNVETESTRKRNRKHTIIRVGAFVAGAGVGALTPPVSAAALIALGLGGPLIGRQGIKLSEKLIAKSNSMKYIDRRNKTVTELAQMDKKIKRNEWWANRLGEVSSALMGAGAGYGVGKAIQSIVNMFGTPSTPPNGQNQSEGNSVPPAGEAGPPQQPTELPATQPVSTTVSELSSGDWLKTGELGWDTSKWGWRGPDLFVPQSGVVEGAVPDLQGKFLDQLSELGVTKDMLYGQQAGEIFNQGLRNAVYTSGSNLQDAASATAQALKNLNN